jgi:hypothetical protein
MGLNLACKGLNLHKRPDSHWISSIIVANYEVENTVCVYT